MKTEVVLKFNSNPTKRPFTQAFNENRSCIEITEGQNLTCPYCRLMKTEVVLNFISISSDFTFARV